MILDETMLLFNPLCYAEIFNAYLKNWVNKCHSNIFACLIYNSTIKFGSDNYRYYLFYLYTPPSPSQEGNFLIFSQLSAGFDTSNLRKTKNCNSPS